MKKIFNNSQLIISLYLLFSFLIDIMTNLTINLSFSVGMILRGLLLLYLLLYILIKYPTKKNITILFLLTIYCILFLIFRPKINSIYYLFKYAFIVIPLLSIYNMYKKDNVYISDNILNITLLTYSLVLIIAKITNTASASYAVAKVGTIGWFNSANEISAIISIIGTYLFISIINKKKYLYIITIIIALIASLIIGTRTPIIVFIICAIYYSIRKIIKDIKTHSIQYRNYIITILLVIIGILLFVKTPLYKNMLIHIHYLGLKSPLDIFTNFKTFDHFIFNRRLSFVLDLNKEMFSSPITNILFGVKYIIKTTEMDLFDILYRYGIIGLLLLIYIIISILTKIKNNKEVNYLPIIIILIVSNLSGHVLLSPNVLLITLIITINTLYKSNKKKILLAAYDMRLGGIEKALVNFIKNINITNNEITLYLENKAGVLLKDLPSNITIKQQKVFDLNNKILSKCLNLLNKIKFLLFNYKDYNFSCCYATYSLSSNFLSRYSSNNNSIYIHSNYVELYKNKEDKIYGFFEPRHLDRFKHIIFVSNESKKDLINYYPNIEDNSIVINNFINDEEILSKAQQSIKEKKPVNKKLFVFVGRIEESSKNLTRLINTFELVIEKNKDVLLWIIGSGPDEEKTKDLIKSKELEDYIIMMGTKTNPYPYMKLANYIILTSNYEGFPVIYGEALTLHKTIISTIDVSDEYISIPNNYGYICKKDELDISKTILKLLKNDKLKYKNVNIKKYNKNKLEMIQELINNH